MLKSLFYHLMFLCMLVAVNTTAQPRSTTLIRSTFEDEGISMDLDKPVYFPGDTARLVIQRMKSAATAALTPMMEMEGTTFRASDESTYFAIIPQTITPGSYRILLRIIHAGGQRFLYETGRAVDVEEHQVVEHLGQYVSIAPSDGSSDPHTAMTLDGWQIRALHVVFQRDKIRPRMGPQFATIRTSVLLRDGTTAQTFERRVVTFRSHGNPDRDRAMFSQYRKAYGAYAAISWDELGRVRLPLDSLPAWSMIRVNIEPDYTITLGAYDGSNSFTRYFRVRGPTIETGFSLGIPKVLYDTRSRDSIEYGNTSAMVRFYHVNAESGIRFPVSLGLGTFGVNSPIDVGVGRGGFALSMFLDLVELMRTFEIDLIKKINLGLEVTPFLSIGKKSRVLLNVQVGFAL
ncbi:MAG: hypothetical protein WEE20_12080 [Bacteroidota bacterium]